MTHMSGFDSKATQECVACGQTKPLLEFDKAVKSQSGYTRKCQECRRLYATESYRLSKAGLKRRVPTRTDDGLKRCPDCARFLPLTAFPRNSASTDGAGGYCKPCHNARGRASKDRVGGSRSYHL